MGGSAVGPVLVTVAILAIAAVFLVIHRRSARRERPAVPAVRWTDVGEETAADVLDAAVRLLGLPAPRVGSVQETALDGRSVSRLDLAEPSGQILAVRVADSGPEEFTLIPRRLLSGLEPSLPVVTVDDPALDASWEVRGDEFALAVTEVTMRTRLLGVSAMGLRFVVAGDLVLAQADGASSPDAEADRLGLLAALAYRVEGVRRSNG